MKTHEMLISPAIASEMLKQNKTNRVLREVLVMEYARQMKAGLWKEGTGETITISENKNILNGQHRLHALVKANVSLRFLVVYGLAEDVFSVLDTGLKRTPGDTLFIAGVTQYNVTAAGVRKYFSLKAGVQLNKTRAISNTEMLALYTSRSKFWDGVALMAIDWYKKSQRMMTTSDWAGFYAFFHDLDENDCFNFLDALANGLNLEAADPVNLLRQKLYFSAINKKFTLTTNHKTALIIKAWNYYRKRKKISMLRFNPETDAFPKPI
jgi:hypothetical protein